MTDLVVGVAKFALHLAEGDSLLQGGEVGPLKILNQRQFDQSGVRRLITDDRWHHVSPGPLARSPAAFARDQLVAAHRTVPVCEPHRLDDNGLDNSVFSDAGGEFVEGHIIEASSRLAGVGHDFAERDLDHILAWALLSVQGGVRARRQRIALSELGCPVAKRRAFRRHG